MKSSNYITTVIINNPTIENDPEETIQQNINTIPEKDLNEIDNLSASLEIYVFHIKDYQNHLGGRKMPKYNFTLKTTTNGEQQHLFQYQVKPLVNTAKNGIANSIQNGIANSMIIAFIPSILNKM